MARTDPPFNLRIPAELKEKIEVKAKASGRSVTAEIITRLEKSFEHEELLSSLTVKQQTEIFKNINEIKEQNERIMKELALYQKLKPN